MVLDNSIAKIAAKCPEFQGFAGLLHLDVPGYGWSLAADAGGLFKPVFVSLSGMTVS